MMKSGERLRMCRMTAGLSFEQVAQKIGCGANRVEGLENEQRRPKRERQLCQLADTFGVSVDYLLGRETPATAKETEESISAAWTLLTDGARRLLNPSLLESLAAKTEEPPTETAEEPTTETAEEPSPADTKDERHTTAVFRDWTRKMIQKLEDANPSTINPQLIRELRENLHV